MNRRNFALSWGRKIFFGVSFPISLVIGLVYLRSFILPASFMDWVYFVLAYVGQLGILNIILYFVMFCPVILLLPTYYTSRLWSLFLILGFNLLLLLDALVFSTFHHHLYEFLSPELWKAGYEYFLQSNVAVSSVVSTVLFILVFFLFKGETTWKGMQRRFSNPVSNWYVVIIFLTFIGSKALFYFQPIDKSLANVLPLNFGIQKPGLVTSDNKKFYFPKGEISCTGKTNPNVIMIVLKNWGSGQVKLDLMGKTFHLKDHAVNYQSHMNFSKSDSDGLFSLFYSLPASYKNSGMKSDPPIIQELKRRNYSIHQFDNDAFNGFARWLDNHSGDESTPFFLSLNFSKNPYEVDTEIDLIISRLEEADLLRNTEIVLTSAYASNANDFLPLYWFQADRKFSEVSHLTTVYDVVPSMMEKFWNCRKVFPNASIGTSLNQQDRKWIFASDEQGLKVFDLEKQNTLHFINGKVSVEGTNPRYDLIFEALKKMTFFNRP